MELNEIHSHLIPAHTSYTYNTGVHHCSLFFGNFAFIYRIQKQGLADTEVLWTFCPIPTTFHPSLSSLYCHPFTPQSES